MPGTVFPALPFLCSATAKADWSDGPCRQEGGKEGSSCGLSLGTAASLGIIKSNTPLRGAFCQPPGLQGPPVADILQDQHRHVLRLCHRSRGSLRVGIRAPNSIIKWAVRAVRPATSLDPPCARLFWPGQRPRPVLVTRMVLTYSSLRLPALCMCRLSRRGGAWRKDCPPRCW